MTSPPSQESSHHHNHPGLSTHRNCGVDLHLHILDSHVPQCKIIISCELMIISFPFRACAVSCLLTLQVCPLSLWLDSLTKPNKISDMIIYCQLCVTKMCYQNNFPFKKLLLLSSSSLRLVITSSALMSSILMPCHLSILQNTCLWKTVKIHLINQWM